MRLNFSSAYFADVPEPEQTDAWSAHLHAIMLVEYIQRLEAALQLLEFAERQMGMQLQQKVPDQVTLSVVTEWQFIAARDSVMTIAHFAADMDSLHQSIAKCPSLIAKMDLSARKAAGRAFREAFPDFIASRHAVAHEGDFNNHAKGRRHAINGSAEVEGLKIENSSDVRAAGNLLGRSFTNTYNGRLVTMDMTADSVRALERVVTLLQAAYGAGGA